MYFTKPVGGVGGWTNPLEKKITQVKLDHFPRDRGETKNAVENHHLVKLYCIKFHPCQKVSVYTHLYTRYPQQFYVGVSENSGTPKSSILIGFSIINYPFWGTPIFGNTHIFYCSSTLHLTTYQIPAVWMRVSSSLCFFFRAWFIYVLSKENPCTWYLNKHIMHHISIPYPGNNTWCSANLYHVGEWHDSSPSKYGEKILQLVGHTVGTNTRLKTNITPWKNGGWKTTLLLGRHVFRGELLVLGRANPWNQYHVKLMANHNQRSLAFFSIFPPSKAKKSKMHPRSLTLCPRKKGTILKVNG